MEFIRSDRSSAVLGNVVLSTAERVLSRNEPGWRARRSPCFDYQRALGSGTSPPLGIGTSGALGNTALSSAWWGPSRRRGRLQRASPSGLAG